MAIQMELQALKEAKELNIVEEHVRQQVRDHLSQVEESLQTG